MELYSRISPEKMVEIFRASPGPTSNGKYLHWDKLPYYKPPAGLTHEEWWWALKLSRRLSYRTMPVVDKKAEPFNLLLDIGTIHEQLHEIDLGGGGRIEMPEPITNPETRDRYYISSLIEEAITSSQLEGAATTRLIAKEMIRTDRAPRDRSEQMILNNYRTMRYINELKDRPLTRELVFDIHRRITEETLDQSDAAGRFRQPEESVVVDDQYGEILHETPLAEGLDARMAAMCDFANGKTPTEFVHPVIRSIILHFWLAYDHPFVDGNGRTARALFYWSMLRHGYWMFEFISISRIILKGPVKYGRAFLYTETDDNDLTYFMLYHLEVIQKAIQELHAYIQRKVEEIRVLEHEMHVMAEFNVRQQALISHALRHPHQRYTIESHRTSHDVAYETARKDLFDLADKKLLNIKKSGRTYYFTPVEDLQEKLRHWAKG